MSLGKTKGAIRGAIPLLFLIILLTNVSAVVNCNLDQEQYTQGEIATFVCSCSVPQERFAIGNFIWRNSSGYVLRNVTGNSGECTGSVFSDIYTIPSSLVNQSGYVNFSTTNSYWHDVGDKNNDNFSIISSTSRDCIIKNIYGSSSLNLGTIGLVHFQVVDSLTGAGLVYASCTAGGLNSKFEPIVVEKIEYTSAGGSISFSHNMIESFWKTNTNYLYEFHCFCLPDSNQGRECYYDNTGAAAGFKSCTVQQTFSTNGNDYRLKNKVSGLGIIAGYFVLVLALLFFMHFFEDQGIAPAVYGTFVLVVSVVMIWFLFFGGYSMGERSVTYWLAALIVIIGFYGFFAGLYFYRPYQEKLENNR